MSTYILNSETRRFEAQKVFVYGTLKKGYPNHDRYLSNSKLLGQAQLEGIMFHLGAFPAINLGENFTKIVGEVYQVSWDELMALDTLEGVPHLYQRIEVSLYPYNTAWTYVFNHEKASREKFLIPSGVWRGTSTPKVAWGGWGRGALVGQFETNTSEGRISIGPGGKQDFELRKAVNGTYNLVRIETGEVLGNYRHLGDMLTKDGSTKPILSLPARNVVSDIKEQVYRQAAHIPENYSPPDRQTILDSPVVTVPEIPKKPFQPQAARLMGIKVREA